MLKKSQLQEAPRPDLDESELIDDEDVEEDDMNERLRTILPWAVSILFHAAMILLAIFIVWSVRQIVEDPPVVPVSEVVDELPGLPEEMSTTETASEAAPTSPTPDVSVPTPVNSPTKIAVTAIGAMYTGGSPGGSLSNGNGTGEGGIFGGGGGGSQRNIVYVIDASGSLVDTLPFVVAELTKSINRMNGGYRFNVIFFSGSGFNSNIGARGGIASLFGNDMMKADAANKMKATSWLQQVEAGGPGNPAPAIIKALGCRFREENTPPQKIMILSDNITGRLQWEQRQEVFINTVVEEAQKIGDVRFVCYQFVYSDPLSEIPGMQGTLRRLVQETGGNPETDYQFVSGRTLGLQ